MYLHTAEKLRSVILHITGKYVKHLRESETPLTLKIYTCFFKLTK